MSKAKKIRYYEVAIESEDYIKVAVRDEINRAINEILKKHNLNAKVSSDSFG